ncbi:MAG: hypothetical protein ABMA13_20055 [Chthoniobacteraceae bacterium]
MKPRSNSHIFAIVLCVLALFVAQTFGSKVGYYCLCGDKPVPTQTSHCHGPHGEKCHTDDAQTGAPHSEEGAGEREDHQVVNQDVQLRPVEAAAQVIAPQVLLAILPMVEVLFASRDAKVSASYSVDFGESPPFGVTVARTIVLLI